jgi:hypothetical protein
MWRGTGMRVETSLKMAFPDRQTCIKDLKIVCCNKWIRKVIKEAKEWYYELIHKSEYKIQMTWKIIKKTSKIRRQIIFHKWE